MPRDIKQTHDLYNGYGPNPQGYYGRAQGYYQQYYPYYYSDPYYYQYQQAYYHQNGPKNSHFYSPISHSHQSQWYNHQVTSTALKKSEQETEDKSDKTVVEEEEKKKYHCSWPRCTRSFARPSALKIHYNTHTGSKPYECLYTNCCLTFSVHSNMLRHAKVCPHSSRDDVIQKTAKSIDTSKITIETSNSLKETPKIPIETPKLQDKMQITKLLNNEKTAAKLSKGLIGIEALLVAAGIE